MTKALANAALLNALRLADYAALRAYKGNATRCTITGYLVSSAPSGISGEFTYDVSDSTSTDNGGTCIVDAENRRWKRVDVEGEYLASWFGLIGSGDETTAITKFLNAASTDDRVAYFDRAVTYTTDTQNRTVSTRIKLHPDATVKLKDSGTMAGTILAPIILRAGDSSIEGGTIDANKAGQNKSAYNAAGGSASRAYYGVYCAGTSGTHITNVSIKTKVINAMDLGVYVLYTDHFDLDAWVHTSGAGARIQNCDNFRASFKGTSLDNDSAKIYPQAFDVMTCRKFEIGTVLIDDQAGYNTLASGLSRMDWFAGMTMISCQEFTVKDARVFAKTDGTMTKSVGVSLINCRSGNLSSVVVKRYTSVLLETGGCKRLNVNYALDGEYQRTSLFASEFQNGHHLHNNSLDNRSRRPLSQTEHCHFTGTITGCLGDGIHLYNSSRCTWTVDSYGNRNGCVLRSRNVNDDFLSSTVVPYSRDNKFISCNFSWNEKAGFVNNGSAEPHLVGCSMNNNGQARTTATPGTLRSTGIYAGPSSGYLGADGSEVLMRARPHLSGCITEDNQTGTSAASVDPGAPTVLSVSDPGLFVKGQTIKLVGAGPASADLITQIVTMDDDAVTVADALSTFPLVVGTGTITCAGTTVTGTGTAFTTQMQGRTWIKVGSEYRRIVQITSATAALLESAFTVNPSGAAFSLVQFNAVQLRSQDWGIYTSVAARDGDTVDVGIRVAGHSYGVGNVLGNSTLLGASPDTEPVEVVRVSTYAALLAMAPPTNRTIVQLQGYYTAGDSHQGPFVWNSTSTATHNGGTVVQPSSAPATGRWLRTAWEIPVSWFGAKGDNTADDYAAIQAAIDWVSGLNPIRGGIVRFQKGRFLLSAPLTVSQRGVSLIGAGFVGSQTTVTGATRLIATHSAGAVIRVQASDTRVQGVSLDSSTARRGGGVGTTTAPCVGIHLEGTDTGPAGASQVQRCRFEDIAIQFQPSTGFLSEGDNGYLSMRQVHVSDNLGHGYQFDRGKVTGRTYEGDPGIVQLHNCRSHDNAGHALVVGNGLDNPEITAYRFQFDNFECYRCGADASLLRANFSVWALGQNLDFLNCAFGGNQQTINAVAATATGVNGAFTIDLAGGAFGVFPGMAVTGTGIGGGATVSSVSGRTVTLSVANSGTVSGTASFASGAGPNTLGGLWIGGRSHRIKNCRYVNMNQPAHVGQAGPDDSRDIEFDGMEISATTGMPFAYAVTKDASNIQEVRVKTHAQKRGTASQYTALLQPNFEGYHLNNSDGMRTDHHIEARNFVSSPKITLADDTVQTIEFSAATSGTLILASESDSGGAAFVYFRVGSSPICEHLGATGANVALGTGALTNGAGDGTDTKMNISAHTDNKLYIKNRRGASRDLRVIALVGVSGQVVTYF